MLGLGYLGYFGITIIIECLVGDYFWVRLPSLFVIEEYSRI